MIKSTTFIRNLFVWRKIALSREVNVLVKWYSIYIRVRLTSLMWKETPLYNYEFRCYKLIFLWTFSEHTVYQTLFVTTVVRQYILSCHVRLINDRRHWNCLWVRTYQSAYDADSKRKCYYITPDIKYTTHIWERAQSFKYVP